MIKILFVILLAISSILEAAPTVVSNSLTPDTEFRRDEIVRIFTRKKSHWSDGHKITVFIKDINSIEHKMFTIDILKITPYRYKSIVDSVVYSGENTPVIEISNDSEMIHKLYTTPYSIGYLNYTVIINDSAKVVQITYD